MADDTEQTLEDNPIWDKVIDPTQEITTTLRQLLFLQYKENYRLLKTSIAPDKDAKATLQKGIETITTKKEAFEVNSQDFLADIERMKGEHKDDDQTLQILEATATNIAQMLFYADHHEPTLWTLQQRVEALPDNVATPKAQDAPSLD